MLHPQSRSDEGLIGTFLASLKELRADSWVLKSESETTDAIKRILGAKGSSVVVLAGLPAEVMGAVEGALEGRELILAERLAAPEAVTSIARADTGITWAECGVASQGAIVEVVYDDVVKLASSLPFHHIALMRSSRVMADLDHAMREVGSIIGSSPAERKPVISFISGPSKTGDIEMKLLYGVHGPNTLSVLILDWC